jgi:hypothetical protein
MSEVMHNQPQEFWRPPVAAEAPSQALAGACERCGTEFMIGARFCHVCGASRPEKVSQSAEHRWAQSLEFLRALEFHRVKEWVALSTASLIAFLAGIGCLFAAIAVGLIYSVQNLADFEAIQLWRIEWLLAALAAFVAGILLKR